MLLCGEHVAVSYGSEQKLAYTVEEAGELLSLSRAHMYRLLESGELGSILIGRCRRITQSQLAAFISRKESGSCQAELQLVTQISQARKGLKDSPHGQSSR